MDDSRSHANLARRRWHWAVSVAAVLLLRHSKSRRWSGRRGSGSAEAEVTPVSVRRVCSGLRTGSSAAAISRTSYRRDLAYHGPVCAPGILNQAKQFVSFRSPIENPFDSLGAIPFFTRWSAWWASRRWRFGLVSAGAGAATKHARWRLGVGSTRGLRWWASLRWRVGRVSAGTATWIARPVDYDS